MVLTVASSFEQDWHRGNMNCMCYSWSSPWVLTHLCRRSTRYNASSKLLLCLSKILQVHVVLEWCPCAMVVNSNCPPVSDHMEHVTSKKLEFHSPTFSVPHSICSIMVIAYSGYRIIMDQEDTNKMQQSMTSNITPLFLLPWLGVQRPFYILFHFFGSHRVFLHLLLGDFRV